MSQKNCENCLNFIFDENFNTYYCDINLDEDEMYRFMSNSFSNCPYFQFNNEYKTVNKQI